MPPSKTVEFPVAAASGFTKLTEIFVFFRLNFSTLPVPGVHHEDVPGRPDRQSGRIDELAVFLSRCCRTGSSIPLFR